MGRRGPGDTRLGWHMQFQNQFDAVDRPMPRERMGRGKISPTTTQAEGPHVMANQDMLRQMKGITADIAAVLWADVLPDGVFEVSVFLLRPRLNYENSFLMIKELKCSRKMSHESE